jgi:hypothetical protein
MLLDTPSCQRIAANNSVFIAGRAFNVVSARTVADLKTER